jgi:translation initiation factor 4A
MAARYDRYGDNRRNYNRPRSYNDRRDYSEHREKDEERHYEKQHQNQDDAKTVIQEHQPKKELSEEELAKREESTIPIENFEDLIPRIDMKIVRGLMAYGFEHPSPIQCKAIKPMLHGYDLIAQAQSGMGKTATFCIGTLGNIDCNKNEIQAIILAHTLELSQQIEYVFKNIGKYVDVRIAQANKSLSVRENIDVLTGYNTDGQLPHIVIGTPGRLLDMFNKNAIKLQGIKLLVIDEADELLSEGFIPQIKKIISSLDENVQICLFSATMNVEFFDVTKHFIRNPINILVNKERLTLEGIKQFYIDCEKNEYKLETLCDLYSILTISQSIIYCNSYKSVEILTKKLQDRNFAISCIHGNMSVADRESTMANFRNCKTRVLISTDLLGRGIDVQQVSIVINYDIPMRYESYIHRIGRSGRHGRKGTAINFVTGYDMKHLKGIESYYNTVIETLPADIQSVL